MNERDERLVAAAERQALAAERLTEALAAPERRRVLEEQAAAFPAPFLLLEGSRGVRTMLSGLPGFAGLWERVVPESHVAAVLDRHAGEWPLVGCVCGVQTVLVDAGPQECAGACGRWFLRLGGTKVRVHRFEDAA